MTPPAVKDHQKKWEATPAKSWKIELEETVAEWKRGRAALAVWVRDFISSTVIPQAKAEREKEMVEMIKGMEQETESAFQDYENGYNLALEDIIKKLEG